ncbi:unnamed protein product [Mytilus coruscus]|uniref:Uncharacterized protein n=1 Tax=Mytilus coruscus TaxID=42192 RepID=A0A6J8DC16_MYTCO|nr:unnamed protein product [Mytilus coruscus]
MKSILLMSEADVKMLIPKPGHSARVWNAIQTLQSLSKQERQESDSNRTSSASVNRIPTYSQKSLPFCEGGEITIPGEKPWQRLNLWYPYPKQKRCMFSNQMLPRMYRAAYANLQTKFETYFCSEIAKRYERKQKVDKWVTFIDFKLSCVNDASYGKLLQLPARPQKTHKAVSQCLCRVGNKKAEITSVLDKYTQVIIICLIHLALFLVNWQLNRFIMRVV